MSEARILTTEELRQIGALQVTPGSWYVVATDDDDNMNAVYVGTVDRGPDHDGACGALPDRAGEVVAITLLQSPAVACHDSEAWDGNARLIAAAPDLRRTALHLLQRVEKAEALAASAQALLDAFTAHNCEDGFGRRDFAVRAALAGALAAWRR